MEKTLVDGKYVDVNLSVKEGKLVAEVAVDIDALVDSAFAKMEAASPAGAVPIEEGAKAMLKIALKSL